MSQCVTRLREAADRPLHEGGTRAGAIAARRDNAKGKPAVFLCPLRHIADVVIGGESERLKSYRRIDRQTRDGGREILNPDIREAFERLDDARATKALLDPSMEPGENARAGIGGGSGDFQSFGEQAGHRQKIRERGGVFVNHAGGTGVEGEQDLEKFLT